MDLARAEVILEEWLRLAIPVDAAGTTDSHLVRPGPGTDAVLEREDQVRQVTARLLGLEKLPELVHRTGNFYSVKRGIDTVRYALARLRTQAETAAILGPTAPTMAADGLHPLIWGAASSLWASGHHAQAVQRAATMLSAHVQDKIGRHDVSDATLMTEAFSDKEPQAGKPRLRWPGEDTDLAVKSMRSGLRLFAPGVFLAIRNPATHETDEMPRQAALERLATLSLLAHWIDGSEVAIP